MYFHNRWVPMAVMDMIFLLWAILALVILFVLYWLIPHFLTRKADRPRKAAGTKRKKRRH